MRFYNFSRRLDGGIATPTSAHVMAAFRQGLGEAAYVEGQNWAIEYRWAEGRYGRLPGLAANLVTRKVDLIMATSLPAAQAAKSATSTTPIVFRGWRRPGLGTGWPPASPGRAVTSRGSDWSSTG